MKKSKYSVVHWGPIFYTKSIVSAHAFRSKCLGRGYIIDPDTKKRVAIGETGLLIFNLETGDCVQK